MSHREYPCINVFPDGTRCTRMAAFGRSLCPPCREMKRAAKQERARSRRNDLGICVQCPNRAPEGERLCVACAAVAEHEAYKADAMAARVDHDNETNIERIADATAGDDADLGKWKFWIEDRLGAPASEPSVVPEPAAVPVVEPQPESPTEEPVLTDTPERRIVVSSPPSPPAKARAPRGTTPAGMPPRLPMANGPGKDEIPTGLRLQVAGMKQAVLKAPLNPSTARRIYSDELRMAILKLYEECRTKGGTSQKTYAKSIGIAQAMLSQWYRAWIAGLDTWTVPRRDTLERKLSTTRAPTTKATASPPEPDDDEDTDDEEEEKPMPRKSTKAATMTMSKADDDDDLDDGDVLRRAVDSLLTLHEIKAMSGDTLVASLRSVIAKIDGND